jgi:hypothetical protein
VPRTAASVSTRVVSWKEAAGDERLGGQRRLGDAEQHRVELRRDSPLAAAAAFASTMRWRSTCSPCRNLVSPGVEHFDLAQHLATITSMCLSLIFTPCRR